MVSPRLTRRTVMMGGIAAISATAASNPGVARQGILAGSPGASPVTTAEPASPLTIIESQTPEYPGSPVAGGELRLFASAEAMREFNPVAFRQDPQIIYSYLDPLVWVNGISLEPEPWLAETWEWADDGLALTFALRRGVKWHDGSPLTADDVRFAMLAYRDDYESASASMFAVVRDVEVLEERRVRVLFDEPDGAFLFNAANLPMFPRVQFIETWERNPVGERTLTGTDWSETTPIGTGPWRIERIADEELSFVRNTEYWAGPAHAERLTLMPRPDIDDQLEAWRDGEVDLIWPVPGDRVEDLADDRGTLYVADAPVSLFAAFNFNNPVRIDPTMLASLPVRRALSLAIDREWYAKHVFGGFIDVDRAGTVTQPWANDPTVRNPTRTLRGANQLLDEIGWIDYDGDGVRESPAGDRLELVCIVREDDDPALLAILDRLNDDLEPIGAAVDVQKLDPAAFNDRWVNQHDFDLIGISLTQYAAFAEYDLYGSAWDVRVNTVGWNPGGYVNEEVDAAIADWFAAWEKSEMRSPLLRLQKASNEDLFALWFGFPQQLVLARPDIQGFQPHKMWQTWDTRLLWRTE
jgi:peptide/nickel transport system substrate-binding protein